MMSQSNVGRNIMRLRKKLGITQAELAERLHVTGKAVSKWECGLGYPEITQLPALSEELGVSVDYLLKGNTRGIVVAGNILADLLNVIEKYPKKGMLANILGESRAVGGCVPNTAIDLAKIDPELFLTAIGSVGNDDLGRFLVGQLKKYGIDTSMVKVSADRATSRCYVMAEASSGDRTFFHYRGANAEFDVDDVDVDALDCEMFHIGYILLLDALDREDAEYGTRLARLLHSVQKRGIKTSIDVVSEDGNRFREKVVPSLKYCDYTIMNEIESCMVTGLDPRRPDGSVHVDNLRRTMERFLSYGVREKVIIHCREAGFLLSADGSFVTVPSLELPDGFIQSNVGAGDAYAAGCLYGLYKGFDDRKLLEFAAAAAACSLSKSDAVGGMESAENIFRLSNSLRGAR